MKLSDLKGLSVAFAGSGGLDSCTITRWLTDEDVKVISFTADLGQPDEPDMEVVRHRMESCRALAVVIEMKKLGLHIFSHGAFSGYD